MTGTADVSDARAAAVELAEAARALIEMLTLTEASPVERRRLAGRVSALAAEMAGLPLRGPAEIASIDDRRNAKAMYSAGSGPASAIAPQITFRDGECGASGSVVMPRRFEGAPGFVHGGFVATLMDEVLGRACVAVGRWGMTVQLDVTYVRPVPVERELALHSVVVRAEGRKTVCTSSIRLRDRPEEALATARGIFVTPPGDVQEQYFGHMRTTAGDPIAIAYERGSL